MRKSVFPLLQEHLPGGVYVVANFLSQVIIYLSFVFGYGIFANEVETKEK